MAKKTKTLAQIREAFMKKYPEVSPEDYRALESEAIKAVGLPKSAKGGFVPRNPLIEKKLFETQQAKKAAAVAAASATISPAQSTVPKTDKIVPIQDVRIDNVRDNTILGEIAGLLRDIRKGIHSIDGKPRERTTTSNTSSKADTSGKGAKEKDKQDKKKDGVKVLEKKEYGIFNAYLSAVQAKAQKIETIKQSVSDVFTFAKNPLRTLGVLKKARGEAKEMGRAEGESIFGELGEVVERVPYTAKKGRKQKTAGFREFKKNEDILKETAKQTEAVRILAETLGGKDSLEKQAETNEREDDRNEYLARIAKALENVGLTFGLGGAAGTMRGAAGGSQKNSLMRDLLVESSDNIIALVFKKTLSFIPKIAGAVMGAGSALVSAGSATAGAVTGAASALGTGLAATAAAGGIGAGAMLAAPVAIGGGYIAHEAVKYNEATKTESQALNMLDSTTNRSNEMIRKRILQADESNPTDRAFLERMNKKVVDFQKKPNGPDKTEQAPMIRIIQESLQQRGMKISPVANEKAAILNAKQNEKAALNTQAEQKKTAQNNTAVVNAQRIDNSSKSTSQVINLPPDHRMSYRNSIDRHQVLIS